MDRYLLASNPLGENKTYLLHTSFPRVLIEFCVIDPDKLTIDNNAVEIKEIFEIHRFVDSSNREHLYKLAIVHYYDNTGILQVLNDLELLKKYYKVVEKGWRWYHSYLKSK